MSISTVDDFTVDIKFKNKQKYSDNFTYIPTKYESYLQTPKVLIPYGINNNNIIDIFYLNKENDDNIKNLLDKFNTLYESVKNKYINYTVNNFIRDQFMRLKLKKYKIYNQYRKEINNLPNNTYGKLIIYLDGLWIVNNDIWFNWIALQIKIDEPIYLQNYSFIDKKTTFKIPPPPPPPPPITKKSTNKIVINKNPKKNDNKKRMNDNIPEISLDEVKKILNNLNKINIFNNI